MLCQSHTDLQQLQQIERIRRGEYIQLVADRSMSSAKEQDTAMCISMLQTTSCCNYASQTDKCISPMQHIIIYYYLQQYHH